MRAKRIPQMPQALGGTALKRGADNKMKNVQNLQDLINKKVVIRYSTTSRLIKKSRKIVKVLDIISQDISLDSDYTPFYAHYIKTKKYGLVSVDSIIRIL